MTTTVTGWDYALILSGFRTIVTVKNGSYFDADIGEERLFLLDHFGGVFHEDVRGKRTEVLELALWLGLLTCACA